MRFDGKVAIVTGASSGIGKAVALAYGRCGARVVIAARREDRGEETATMIRNDGGEALYLRCDVSVEAQVEQLIADTVDRYGRIDICCNNAGVSGERGTGIDLSEAEWDEILGVNLKGMYFCLKHELSHMLPRGAGAIVNVASYSGIRGCGRVAYASSKHGVVGLTRSAAYHCVRKGIRINAVCPGIVPTEMTADSMRDPDRKAKMIAGIPMRRFGKPEEIAEAVLWLGSEKASYITGQILAVDGGMTLR